MFSVYFFRIMKIRNILLAAVAVLGMASCSNDDFLYQDQARVRLVGPKIYTSGTDSLNFSFVTVPSGTDSKTLNVDVYIMGTAANRDRTAAISIDAAKTTATSDMYEMPTTVTIPADSTHAVLPVVIKRTDAILTKSVYLYIRVAESADFAVGVNEQNHLMLIWNDKISKPNNWDDLTEFFGEYSDTKYRFMLETLTGVGELDADTMSWALLMSYRIKCQNALDTYNAAHPSSPLTDENGNLVSFN